MHPDSQLSSLTGETIIRKAVECTGNAQGMHRECGGQESGFEREIKRVTDEFYTRSQCLGEDSISSIFSGLKLFTGSSLTMTMKHKASTHFC